MDDERAPLLAPQPPPAPKKKRSTLLTVCPYILGNELCERLAYYGLATNLVTYITTVIGGNPASAAIIVAVFEGLCYTTPIIGALFADSLWGRYKTILIFSSIYLVGIALLAASSWDVTNSYEDYDDDPVNAWPVGQDGGDPTDDDSPDYWAYSLLCSSLAVIALGTGGIKPNVAAFGADQFNEHDPRDKAEKDSFFNWFYLAINVGSLIACTVIVYVQDTVSWTIGFAIPGIAMALALVLFVAGSHHYKHVRPTESPMARVVKVVWAAMKNRWKRKHSPSSPSAEPQDTSSLHGGSMYSKHMRDSNNGHGSNGQLWDASEQVFDQRLQVPVAPSLSYRWLEDAVTEWQTSQGQFMQVGGMAGYTPKQVEEVKLVLRLLPVFGTTVVYWTIYTQMSSFFIQQGQLMQRSMHWEGQTFRIPSASMSIFNTVAIIVLISLYDKLLEPMLKNTRYKLTLLRRIGWGMVIAAMTMACAAVVEYYRLQAYHNQYPGPNPQVGDSNEGKFSSLSIFWQAPQYVLIGLSEVFTSIGQIEFFYDQAPDVMRSCSMALGLLSTAMGSYLAGALTWAVQACSESVFGQQWLPNDLNKGRLDLFFLFMMVFMIINTLFFLWVASSYEYKAVEHRGRTTVDGSASAQNAIVVPIPSPPTAVAIGTSTYGHAAPTARLVASAGPVGSGLAGAAAAGRPAVQSASVSILRGRALGAAAGEEEEDASAMDVYARSLAYVPPSPLIPAPFR